jgi:hypothetical protein
MSTAPVYYLRADEDEDFGDDVFELSIQTGPGLGGDTIWSEHLPKTHDYREARKDFSNPGEEWLDQCREFEAIEAIIYVGGVLTDAVCPPDESGESPLVRLIAALKRHEGIEG